MRFYFLKSRTYFECSKNSISTFCLLVKFLEYRLKVAISFQLKIVHKRIFYKKHQKTDIYVMIQVIKHKVFDVVRVLLMSPSYFQYYNLNNSHSQEQDIE